MTFCFNCCLERKELMIWQNKTTFSVTCVMMFVNNCTWLYNNVVKISVEHWTLLSVISWKLSPSFAFRSSFVFSVHVKLTDVIFQGNWRSPPGWHTLDLGKWNHWRVCHAWSKASWCVPRVCLLHWDNCTATCKFDSKY